ncbi:natterin-4-like [Brachyhypopomus gauderio]|uniref:natterin-4-like n=1 Tax=Brachyhypopomus gauderio TaxID=698409 RepID=UPI004042740D
MDQTTIFLLALLQMGLDQAALSSDLPQDQMLKPSHNHQRRGTIEDQNAIQNKNNLKWVKSSGVPKDAYFYTDNRSKKINYIVRNGCELGYSDGTTIGIVTHTSPDFSTYKAFKGDVEYLVNENEFEILEWKVATYGDIPPLAVEFCEKMFVVKTEGGLGFIEAKGNHPKISLPVKDRVQYEFLTLNRDIEGQYLSNVIFNLEDKTDISQDIQVLRQFTTVNTNCNPVKQQAKLEKTVEKTISFQIAGSLTIGVATEFTGKIPLVAGMKLSLSGRGAFTLSRTSSTTEKNINFLTVEAEIPPNHTCSVIMTSIINEAKVEFTGELTRIYKNKEVRR